MALRNTCRFITCFKRILDFPNSIDNIEKLFSQVNRAWALYKECMEKGLPLYVRSYNSILRLVQFTKDSGDERKHLMLDVLSGMSKAQVRPNVGTLNAALQISSMLRSPHPGREIALSVYKEFTNAGVEPSLGSYFYLLTIFCRNSESNVLINDSRNFIN